MASQNVFLQSAEAPYVAYAKDEEEVRSMLLDEDNGPRREKRRREESGDEPARNVRRFDAHGPPNAAPSPPVTSPVVTAHANLNPAAPHAVNPIVDAPVNSPPIQVNVLPNITLNPPMLPVINLAISNPLLVRRRLPTRRALAAATHNLPPAPDPPANPFVVYNLDNVTANLNPVVVANPVDTVNPPVVPSTGSSEEEEDSDDEGYLGEPESDSGSAIASGSGVATDALDRSTGQSRRRRYTKTAADWSNGGKKKAKESYSTFSHEESSASFSEDEIQYGEGDYNEEDSDSDAFYAQRIADAIAASRGAQVLISPLTAIHIPAPVPVTVTASPPSPPFFLPIAPRPLRRTYTMAQL